MSKKYLVFHEPASHYDGHEGWYDIVENTDENIRERLNGSNSFEMVAPVPESLALEFNEAQDALIEAQSVMYVIEQKLNEYLRVGDRQDPISIRIHKAVEDAEEQARIEKEQERLAKQAVCEHKDLKVAHTGWSEDNNTPLIHTVRCGDWWDEGCGLIVSGLASRAQRLAHSFGEMTGREFIEVLLASPADYDLPPSASYSGGAGGALADWEKELLKQTQEQVKESE